MVFDRKSFRPTSCRVILLSGLSSLFAVGVIANGFAAGLGGSVGGSVGGGHGFGVSAGVSAGAGGVSVGASLGSANAGAGAAAGVSSANGVSVGASVGAAQGSASLGASAGLGSTNVGAGVAPGASASAGAPSNVSGGAPTGAPNAAASGGVTAGAGGLQSSGPSGSGASAPAPGDGQDETAEGAVASVSGGDEAGAFFDLNGRGSGSASATERTHCSTRYCLEHLRARTIQNAALEEDDPLDPLSQRPQTSERIPTNLTPRHRRPHARTGLSRAKGLAVKAGQTTAVNGQKLHKAVRAVSIDAMPTASIPVDTTGAGTVNAPRMTGGFPSQIPTKTGLASEATPPSVEPTFAGTALKIFEASDEPVVMRVTPLPQKTHRKPYVSH